MKSPLPFDTAVYGNHVFRFVAVTFTPAITAPDESVTVPTISAVETCAVSRLARRLSRMTADTTFARSRVKFKSFPLRPAQTARVLTAESSQIVSDMDSPSTWSPRWLICFHELLTLKTSVRI